MTERSSINAILLTTAKWGAKLFRQNTGMGWAGKVKRPKGYPKGTVVIDNARPLHAGLCTGSSDIIGWVPVVVTAEMVGKTVAVFTAIEDKEIGVATTPEQARFLRILNENGGFGILAKARAGVDAAAAAIEALALRIEELKEKRPD